MKTKKKIRTEKKIRIGTGLILVLMGLSGCSSAVDKEVITRDSTVGDESVSFNYDGELPKTRFSETLEIIEDADTNKYAMPTLLVVESENTSESAETISESDKPEEETFESVLNKCNDFLRDQKYYSLTLSENTEIKMSNVSTNSEPKVSIRNNSSSVKSYRDLENNEISLDISSSDRVDGDIQAENSESSIVVFDKLKGKYKLWSRSAGMHNNWVDSYIDKIPDDMENLTKAIISGSEMQAKKIEDLGSIYVLSGKVKPEIKLNGSLTGCSIGSESLVDIGIYIDKETFSPIRIETQSKNVPVVSNNTAYIIEVTNYSKTLKYDSFEKIDMYVPGSLEGSEDNVEYNEDGTEDLSKSLVGLKLKDAELKEFVLVPTDYDVRLEANTLSTSYVYKDQGEYKELYSVIIENSNNEFAYAINCKIVDASYAGQLSNESKIMEKFHR